MKTRILLAIVLFLGVAFPVFAQEIRILNPIVKPGGVLLIQAGRDATVTVFERTYRPNIDGLIFVGIDIRTPSGTYSVDEQNTFLVEEFRAPVRHRAPSPLTVRRKKELELLKKYFSYADEVAWYPEKSFSGPLLDVFITSEFGIGHGGTDLRASRGTPVHAINDGRVLMVAKKFSLEGNMVIVDHGSGVLSIYMHLSGISVKEGLMVKKGEVIGLSGATGSTRGPHLHFSVKVNGVNVDSFGFIGIINQVLFGES